MIHWGEEVLGNRIANVDLTNYFTDQTSCRCTLHYEQLKLVAMLFYNLFILRTYR